MANLNRDYLVTLDVKTSNITLSSPMTFYVTDRRTMNIFVKLVMNMSDNPVIKDYVALENAIGYRTELVLVAPNNQPFYLEGELLNGDEALFCFNLDTEQISKIGDWVCELRVYSIVEEDEEIVTSKSFLYSVNESITTSLDDVVLDDTTYGIIDELIGRIEALEGSSPGGENDTRLTILEATKYDDVQVQKTQGKITLTFYAEKTKMKTVEIPASEGLEQRVADCEESIAWLLENGGGGSGVVSAYLSTTDSENFILTGGTDLELHLDFYSPNIGKGTLKVTVDDVDVMSSTLNQGESTVVITGDLLHKGVNVVKVYAVDRVGTMTNTLVFNVRYGSTELTTTFDPYQIYDVGAVVRYYFTAVALNTADKLTFYMSIDGQTQAPVDCTSDVRAYFTFPILSIGSHYCEAWVEDSYGKSNTIAFNFVVLDDSSLAINSTTRTATVEEGAQLILDYRVYMKGNNRFKVSIFVDDVAVSSGECNADTNYYTTSSLKEGQHIIKIQAWDMYLAVTGYVTWVVNITPSTYEMKQPVTTGAIAMFTAKDRTNADQDRETWTGRDQDGTLILADLSGFSYDADNGWNNNELIISGKSTVEIPIAPLANNARYGFTLDVEFTSKQIGAEDAEVLSLWNETDNCGIKITTERLILRSKAGNECNLFFSDNENVSAMFIIDRDEKVAKIYLNGVMCEAFSLSDYVAGGQAYLEDFTVDSNIILGGGADKNGYCKIKNLRVYEVALATNEILNNWLSNITDKTAQRDMEKFQNGDDLPTLTVYCDFAGLGKDDKKPCDIIYYSPDVTKYGESFTLSGKTSQLQYQGTSSMQYPIKNYRLNLRDASGSKWYYNPYDGGQPECRFTLKADFMSSGHWQNTGLAKFVSDKLYGYKTNDLSTMNPAKRYDIQNGGTLKDTRDSINGFPCRLILVNDGSTPLNEGQQEPTPGNTKDMGIFNFNNDKDNVTSLGLDTEIFPNALSFEVTANSDTSAGAFVPCEKDILDYTTADGMDSCSVLIPVNFVEGNRIQLSYTNKIMAYDENKNYLWTTANGNTVVDIPTTGYFRIAWFSSDISFGPYGSEMKAYTRGNKVSASVVGARTEESKELEYLQNSFELRYPDEDDVGSDYGYLGMPVNAYHFRTAIHGGARATSNIPVSFFNTDELILEDTDFSGAGTTINIYVDDVRQQVGAWQLANEPYTIDISSAEKIKFEPYGNTNWTYLQLNGVKYFADNIHDPYDTNLYEPHIKEQFSTDYGLKRVIDWVGNCTDEEFVADYEKYFNKHYLLRYYLLVITLGMVDNLGKNMMFDTWDGQIWYPRFYDMDTICSYDNSGAIKFDVDIEMAQGYWNTSSSRLWTKVRDLLHDELVVAYKDMRASGLSYDGLMNYFYGEQIAKIPQKYYNMDADVKYLPYADEYLGKAHGNGYEHLKRWLKNRLIFTDTLFDYGPSYESDMLTIRANTLDPITFEIETYTPVYQHVSYYNGQMSKLKIDGKTATTFTGNAQTATDQEILIYGGSNIKRIRGISSANPDSMLIGNATKLAELDISNCPILIDVNSNKANFAPHQYLNKLNIENCPQLGGTLELTYSPLIQEIKAKGTAISGLRLPTSVKNLETLELPNTINSLALYDATSLETLKFDEGVAMQSIELSNCPGITNTENFDLTKTPTVILDNSYDTDELYMSETTNLTLRNMSNLERVIYTPNSEYSEFDINNVINGSNYEVTTNGCPKLTTFMTTAPQRLSYNNGEYGDITPNTVFTANTLDLSNTQFTDIKLLCTTDVYNLKVPTTMKNFYCDSAMDIDTDVIEDASYEVIHEELIEPYTTNYEGEIELMSEKPQVISIAMDRTDKLVGDRAYNTDYIEVSPNSTYTITTNVGGVWLMVVGFDENKSNKVTIYQAKNANDNGAISQSIPEGIHYIMFGAISSPTLDIELYKPYTPNLIPSSANGSLIFNMYSNNTTQPTSASPYMWDLTGLKLNDFHTYGMNNWVKAGDDSYVNIPKDVKFITSWGANNTLGGAYVSAYKSLTPIIFDDDVTSVTFISDDTICYSAQWSDTQRSGQSAWGKELTLTFNEDQLNYKNVMLMCVDNPTYIKVSCNNGDNFMLQFDKMETLDGRTLTSDEVSQMSTYISNSNEKLSEVKSITMPQRMPGYSVRLVNADITPNEYPTMLYPKWIDTGLPITGKLDYTKYNGASLAWAYAYTTGDVDIKPLDSRSIGQITNDYNKLYGTDFVDVVDVWVYKDTDVSGFSTNEAIKEAYIELTSDNYKTRVDEVLAYYPNCTDVYFFEDGNMTSLAELFIKNTTSRNQIEHITFMEGYFDKVTSMVDCIRVMPNLLTITNLPKNLTAMNQAFYGCGKLTTINAEIPSTVITLAGAFRNCYALNQLIDLSNVALTDTNGLVHAFNGCKALTIPPILPSNYKGSMQECFRGCSSLTTLPIIPSGVTTLRTAFHSCTGLTDITLSGLTNLKDDALMDTFASCTNLVTVTIGDIDMTNVANIGAPSEGYSYGGMFQDCNKLERIIGIEDWNLNNIRYACHFYKNCWAIEKVKIPLRNTGDVFYYNMLGSNATQTKDKVIEIIWDGLRKYDLDVPKLLGANRTLTQAQVKDLVNNHLDVVNLAYIEKTVEADYIDIPFGDIDYTKIRAMEVKHEYNGAQLIKHGTSGIHNQGRTQIGYCSNTFYAFMGNVGTTQYPQVKNECVLRVDATGIYEDGLMKYDFKANNMTFDPSSLRFPMEYEANFRIFGEDGWSAGTSKNGKLFFLKIYGENDELLHHILPYTDGNRVGIIDDVTKKTYFGSDTTTFSHGVESKTLTLGAYLEYLTEDEIAQATAKGWILQ